MPCCKAVEQLCGSAIRVKLLPWTTTHFNAFCSSPSAPSPRSLHSCNHKHQSVPRTLSALIIKAFVLFLLSLSLAFPLPSSDQLSCLIPNITPQGNLLGLPIYLKLSCLSFSLMHCPVNFLQSTWHILKLPCW
jgi:hypothetical protein